MGSNHTRWSLTVALAGFLFGFDTVVISGADISIQQLWQTSDWFHGTFVMSMALWGTVIGALFGGWPSNRLGRKKTLFWIGILYFLSALGSALSTDPYLFSFFRFIGGLGVGASSVAAPTYVSEIARPQNRGRLVALYQFNIVFGILIAFISNYLLQGVGGDADWRFMMGVEALPALIYVLLVKQIPNSPRWLLIYKKDEQAALAVLKKSASETEAQLAINEMKEAALLEDTSAHGHFFSGKYKVPIVLAFLLAFFNQLSGINFILYYAPRILQRAGFGSADSLLSSVSIGGINLIFTMLGMYLIDRAGRKQLMYMGSFGYIISLSMTAYGFYSGAAPIFTLSFILLFIASHAIGQGAVIWVFISEIFPNRVRAYGQSLGSGTHWVFAALITLFGTVAIQNFEPHMVFAFFAVFMILQLLFVAFMMPETKGISLEDLQHRLIKEDKP